MLDSLYETYHIINIVNSFRFSHFNFIKILSNKKYCVRRTLYVYIAAFNQICATAGEPDEICIKGSRRVSHGLRGAHSGLFRQY